MKTNTEKNVPVDTPLGPGRTKQQAEQRQLDRTLKQLEHQDILILEERGHVLLSRTGPELLFEVIRRACERLSLIITTNLPFGVMDGNVWL